MNLPSSPFFPLSAESQLKDHGYIEFASVGRPHGLKGGFFLKTPDRRSEWDGYSHLLLETPSGFRQLKVSESYLSANALVLRLEGISSRTEVESLYNKRLFVHQSLISTSENEYVVGELKRFTVIDEQGLRLGRVLGVISYGAQDNLEIELTGGKKTILFPFLDQFVHHIDRDKKEIAILHVEEFLNEEE